MIAALLTTVESLVSLDDARWTLLGLQSALLPSAYNSVKVS
jgi:hypothetical protein